MLPLNVILRGNRLNHTMQNSETVPSLCSRNKIREQILLDVEVIYFASSCILPATLYVLGKRQGRTGERVKVQSKLLLAQNVESAHITNTQYFNYF